MMPDGKKFHIETFYKAYSNGMEQSHAHDFYEIYYLLDGKRRYFINDAIYDAAPFDVILVNKGDVHLSQSPKSSEYRYCVITLSDEFLDGLGAEFDKDLLLKIFGDRKLHIPTSMQSSFNMLIHKAESKINNDDIYSEYFAKLHILELLIMLNKLAANSTYPIIDNSIYDSRISDVCRYICQYYNEPITLNQMANIAYMSPSYFSKKFKRVTGFSFKEYLNNIRIKTAINILTETKYSIAEVASYCGYHDSNYFGDVFKKIVGVSPNQYRKEHSVL